MAAPNGLLLVDEEGDGEVVFGVEGADGFAFAFLVVEFGPEGVVGVLGELDEAEGAVVVGDGAFYGGGAGILQVDYGSLDAGSGFVFDFAVDDALDGASILGCEGRG